MSIMQYFNLDSAPLPLAWNPSWAKPDVWFDPSVLDTMFIERSGAINPAYAGSPVGMMLDTRLTKGAELYTGQTMSVDLGGSGTEFAVDQSLRKVEVTKAGTNNTYPRINFNLGLVPDKYYIVRGRMAKTGAMLYPQNIRLNTIGSDNNLTTNMETGEFYGIQKAGSVFINFMMNGTLLGSLSIVELSVKEMIIPIAVAPTDAARPTLARMPKTGSRNLLTYTEDFSNTYWVKSGVFLNTPTKLTESATNAIHRVYSQIIGNRGVYTAFFDVSAAERSLCEIWVGNASPSVGAGTRFNLQNGTVVNSRTVGGSLHLNSGVINLGGGVFRCYVTMENTGTQPMLAHLFIIADGLPNNTIAYQGDGVSGINVYRSQMELGLDATPYQKVTNAFDVTEAGVPDVWSLEFDGVDDIQQTNVISGWEANGASFSCAMQSDVVASGKSSAGMVFGLSVSGFATYYWLGLRPNQPLASHAVSYRVGGGALTQASLDKVLNKTLPFVVTSITDLASVKAFVNGELKSQSPTPAAGTIDAPVVIGSTEQPCKFYGGLMIKRALQETEVKLLSKYLVDKAGVTL